MGTDHDRELGAALRSLPVPEHRDGFFDELEHELRPRRRRPGVRRLLVAAAAAAVVAVGALVGLDRHGARRIGPQPARAADVVRRVAAAYAGADSLAGTLVITNVEGTLGGTHTMRWSFALRGNGDFRISELPNDDGGGILFLAGKGEELSTDGSTSTAPVYGDRHGLAPGPPDTGPTEFFVQRDLGSVIAALAAGRSPSLGSTTYRGRPAWVLAKPASLHLVVPEEPTDRLAVTVDKATGFPVRIVETERGRFVSEIRVDDLQVDGATPSAFEVATAPGQQADSSDAGFRHVPLERAAGAVGYAPLAATWLPDGYAQAETAVARAADPTAMGQNPPSRDVVSTAYRRGIGRFIVTTRRAGAGPWVDPLHLNEHVTDRGKPVAFGKGALAGATGRLVVTPGEAPHVWVVTHGLVVTISGDLTGEELVRVAESLTAVG
jgi:outer membrane lipoprotein-sorting protein